MKPLFWISVSLLLTGTVILFSCGSNKIAKTTITIESGEIPPEMRNENFTILVRLDNEHKHYNKDLTKEFSNYSGSYLIVSDTSKLWTTYKDVNKYRYEYGSFLHPEVYNDPQSGRITLYKARFYIYDRKKEVMYKSKLLTTYYDVMTRAYIRSIEEVRKK